MALHWYEIETPLDGSWHPDNTKDYIDTHYSKNRPRLYYFALVDCNDSFQKSFKAKNKPRVDFELALFNIEANSHFSYEDIGLLELNFLLICLTTPLAVMLITSYRTNYLKSERCCSPHLMMLVAIVFQVFSLACNFISLLA